MKKIPVLTIVFSNKLDAQDIPAFRGAVISKVPASLTLFHNHIGNNFRYNYPLVQYKILNGKAAIVCLGEGTESITAFFESSFTTMKLNGHPNNFSIDHVHANQWLLQVWKGYFSYFMASWLPLNEINYIKYQQLSEEEEIKKFLEAILVGNIMSMCKGLNYFIEETVECKIDTIVSSKLYWHKGVKFQGFNIIFTTNVYFVNGIGLGKGASMGFGVIRHNNNTHIQAR